MNPLTIGRVVHYVSRTGAYEVPGIITMTEAFKNQAGVDAGFVPDLTNPSTCVHLTVFTPGKPGKRADAHDFLAVSDYPISENVSGCYQEWDITHLAPTVVEHEVGGVEDKREVLAGTWHWPSECLKET